MVLETAVVEDEGGLCLRSLWYRVDFNTISKEIEYF